MSERRQGHSRLVYDKATRTIVTERSAPDAAAEIDRLREVLRRVAHTLMVHGHIDAGTPLHKLVMSAVDTAERDMEKAMGPRQDPLHPMFRDHNCSYCASGEKPCKQGNPSSCEYPHARND